MHVPTRHKPSCRLNHQHHQQHPRRRSQIPYPRTGLPLSSAARDPELHVVFCARHHAPPPHPSTIDRASVSFDSTTRSAHLPSFNLRLPSAAGLARPSFAPCRAYIARSKRSSGPPGWRPVCRAGRPCASRGSRSERANPPPAFCEETPRFHPRYSPACLARR